MVRAFELAGLIAFGLLWIAGAAIYLPLQALAVFLSLPIGYYFADLFSGLLHWVCDSFGSSETTLFGPALIKPFRDHHKTPQNITKISLLENLGASAMAGTAVGAAALPFIQAFPAEAFLPAALSWTIWWFLLFAVASNLFHRWAHRPQKPRWMKFLQQKKIILSSQTHGIHHVKPYRWNYCILCGWANPLTNSIPWARIEQALAKIGVRTNFD